MFPLGFWFGFGFEVQDKASQEIQTLFSGFFWYLLDCISERSS